MALRKHRTPLQKTQGLCTVATKVLKPCQMHHQANSKNSKWSSWAKYRAATTKDESIENVELECTSTEGFSRLCSPHTIHDADMPFGEGQYRRTNPSHFRYAYGSIERQCSASVLQTANTVMTSEAQLGEATVISVQVGDIQTTWQLSGELQ